MRSLHNKTFVRRIEEFVISRLYSIHFTATLVGTRDIVRYIEDFVKSRFHCILNGSEAFSANFYIWCCFLFIQVLFVCFFNLYRKLYSPRSIYQYSKWLRGFQDKLLYFVLFSFYSSLFWKEKETSKIYNFDPSHFRILIYRTWPIKRLHVTKALTGIIISLVCVDFDSKNDHHYRLENVYLNLTKFLSIKNKSRFGYILISKGEPRSCKVSKILPSLTGSISVLLKILILIYYNNRNIYKCFNAAE